MLQYAFANLLQILLKTIQDEAANLTKLANDLSSSNVKVCQVNE